MERMSRSGPLPASSEAFLVYMIDTDRVMTPLALFRYSLSMHFVSNPATGHISVTDAQASLRIQPGLLLGFVRSDGICTFGGGIVGCSSEYQLLDRR